MAWSALDLTDRILEDMERHLRGIYNRAAKEVGGAWKKYMADADESVSGFQKAYDAAKDNGDKDAIRKAGRDLAQAKQQRTIYNSRYQSLTQQLARDISRVNEVAADYINGRLPEVYVINYNEVTQRVNKQLKGRLRGYSFDLVDQNTIRRLSTTEENLLPLMEVNGRRDVRWNVAKINSEVTQGILQGESMPKIAQRFSNVMSMDRASAIRNARTTVTSAQNKGRMDMMHEALDKGVIVKKGWSAARDKRVRDWHVDLDNGQFIDIDEPFHNEYGDIMYPGDPDAAPANVYNCRCSLIYKVVGFK